MWIIQAVTEGEALENLKTFKKNVVKNIRPVLRRGKIIRIY